MTRNDLSDKLGNLTPAEWRAILVAVAQHRCIACGRIDGCECSDEVDVAKALVTRTADEAS